MILPAATEYKLATDEHKWTQILPAAIEYRLATNGTNYTNEENNYWYCRGNIVSICNGLFDVVTYEIGDLLQLDDRGAEGGHFLYIANHTNTGFEEDLVFAVIAGILFKVKAVAEIAGN